MLGPSALNQENSGFVMRTYQVLESRQRNEQARAFSMLDDGYHVPIMIQDLVSVADFDVFRLCRPVVDEQIIRAFQVMALKENESTRDGAKAFGLDAPNGLDHTFGIELEQSRRRSLEVFQFRQLVRD